MHYCIPFTAHGSTVAERRSSGHGERGEGGEGGSLLSACELIIHFCRG